MFSGRLLKRPEGLHPYSHKYGNMGQVKTTLEMPDALFRRAKATAAHRGIPLRQFVTEAVEEKLKVSSIETHKPWMKHIGKLKRFGKETQRIDKVIEDRFEQIEPETWE
ncbi:MAG TPA: hypothetical protein VG498_16715 [Terriglobales bacterium]|nr:hypothetical protein [Terriglobales bacterium]